MAMFYCPGCDTEWEDPDEGEHMTGLSGHHCPECGGVRMMRRVWPDECDPGQLAWRIAQSSAARGVDLWAVEDCGFSATEWADVTSRDRSTVSRNVRRARRDSPREDGSFEREAAENAEADR